MFRQLYFCCEMYTRLPYLFKIFFPKLIWEIQTSQKEIYLTFDDGPDPEITPKVLDILDQYNAKATFFCVGENVVKHHELYTQLLEKGHCTGNHSYNHVNGWKIPSKEYYENIAKCTDIVDSHLFRPPYGRIKPTHIPYLKMQFQIIMWTVLTEDYITSVKPEKCLDKSIRFTRSGSIVVFHDSPKASKNMLFALPRFLNHFSKLGYRYPSIKV